MGLAAHRQILFGGLVVALLAGPAPAAARFPADPPNDPLFDASPLPNATNEQWDLASPAAGYDRGISVDRAWSLSTGAGVAIADIDVGVDLDHPDLRGQWCQNARETPGNAIDDDRNGFVDDMVGWDVYERDGDPTADTRNDHGTNVAGVLSAATDNGIGIASIAPDACVLPVRTSDGILHQGTRVAQGLAYAVRQGARVASLSLGTDTFSAPLRRAVTAAHRRGTVIAVAIGNEFHFHHHMPQLLDEVLAVGGVNPDTANLAARDERAAVLGGAFDVHASYSDVGPHIDVVAPTQVPSTQFGGGYRMTWDGTSAATPHVAGTAALVIARGRAQGIDLSAGEVMQIVRMTADDVAAPGWDRRTGWGRVNAFAAVSRAAPRRIPPVPDLRAPDWYAPLASRRIEVRGSITARTGARWILEFGPGETPREWNELARGTTTRGERHLDTLEHLPPGGYTLRLRAVDADGNRGEDRSFFTVLGDPTLKPGFPLDLRTSGEASPALADLDGDGAAELVLAGSDGVLRVRSGRDGRTLRGWPRRMRAAAGSRPLRGLLGPARAGFTATPAIGDVTGDGRSEVVTAGLDGRIYAWSARGRAVPGFPFRIGLRRPAERGRLDAAILATPALADLDRDGRLDIVVGAADQRIYAVDGRGRLLPGWPVLARSAGDVTKILSSPAIGDLDGDGAPEVVEGTAEAYGSTPATSGRVHAFHGDGRGVVGWPVAPEALAADSIPIAGEGVPMSPVIADVDGDGRDEVAIAAFTGRYELYRGDGTRLTSPDGPHFRSLGRGGRSRASSVATLALGANAAFGRLHPEGPLRFFGGLVDANLAPAQLSPALPVAFEHLLGGWDARTGAWLRSFPAPIEGWQIPTAPAIADVDGDGRSEVIAGSSGTVLHAFREDGTEPRGWPKHPGGWLLASPAVGDVDGDGLREVVALTRAGFVFVWDTQAPADATADWPSFRHDVRNSGRWSDER